MIQSKRSSVVSSTASWMEADSEHDIDTIMPCPPDESHDSHDALSMECHAATSPDLRRAKTDPISIPRPIRRDSSASAENVDDVHGLWKCMLELQHRYGCYNSARMEAALSMGGDATFMPSRGVIDLLNDSIDELPEAGWEMLGKFLSRGDQAERRKWWKFWHHA